MWDRRHFLKTALVSGGAAATHPIRVVSSRYQDSSGCFGVHPFIENHPEAVFIMHTDVDVKTNSASNKLAGNDFGRSVIVPKKEEDGGVPLTSNIALKPNLTCRGKWQDRPYTIEGSMGIVTDVHFVEGIIESMKELGLSGSQFYIREVNCPQDFAEGGYFSMAERTGADLRDLSAKVGRISENDLQWVDVPDGVWFNKIPYLWPINAPDTFLLNIAKFKAHEMCMTLTAKNLQGMCAHNYQQHCASYNAKMDINVKHYNQDAFDIIHANWERRVSNGLSRMGKPGYDFYSGLGLETWAARCLDNNLATTAGLHIVEGIYGRDGNFLEGPNEGELANDYMTNIIIFGMNPFYIDNIGTWLGGHEPGNVGLFHTALERGFSTTINPMDIPVYEWKADGSAVLTSLTDFQRFELKTLYLAKDWDGQDEDWWHLCNEPYDYGSSTGVDESGKPEVFVLGQNYPNPFNPATSIEYTLPSNGNVRLDIYNASGQRVDVLVNGFRTAGSHMAVWNENNNHSSGIYFYHFRFGSYTETKKMMLMK